MSEEKILAQLNEVSSMLRQITSGQLKDILGGGGALQAVGCTGNCDCRGGYCGCNASVTAYERFGNVSFPEFLEMREARMRELKAELNSLEAPKSIG